MSEHHTFQSNATNAWIFNGTNGRLNNNNVANSNRVRAATNLLKTVILRQFFFIRELRGE